MEGAASSLATAATSRDLRLSNGANAGGNSVRLHVGLKPASQLPRWRRNAAFSRRRPCDGRVLHRWGGGGSESMEIAGALPDTSLPII